MPVIAVAFKLYGTLADVIIDETSSARWQSLASEPAAETVSGV
jgi:hypothetical protein